MNFRYIVEGAGVGVPFSATTVVGAGVDLTISLRINSCLLYTSDAADE